MAVGHGPARHQGGDHRDLGQLEEPAQQVAGARADDAATDVQDGATGLPDQPGGLADLLVVRPGDRAVAGQVDLRRPLEGGAGLQRVLADVDQHRARSSRGGDVERLGDRPRDLRRVGDQVVVLGDRHRDAADVGLLEGIRADRGRRDLTGDGHHGHRVHVGVGDRRDQVGGARTAGGHAHPDLAGGRRVTLGRVAGALLVTDEDVPDLGGVHQRVVGRQDRAAGDAEDGVDPDALERLDQALCAGDLDRPGGADRRREVGRRGVLGAGGPRGRGWPCGLAVRHCRHRFQMRSVPVVGPWRPARDGPLR